MDSSNENNPSCLSRRRLLLTGATTMIMSSFPGVGSAVPLKAKTFERKYIAKASDLKLDTPVDFLYPFDDMLSSNMLVKLGVSAGSGVGETGDIVAFSQFCTHMGGPLHGTYKGQHKAVGPCPMHLTTFDLTRHGMVISGHATESLPQIILELDGDSIFAVGVMGLIYGRHSNFS